MSLVAVYSGGKQWRWRLVVVESCGSGGDVPAGECEGCRWWRVVCFFREREPGVRMRREDSPSMIDINSVWLSRFPASDLKHKPYKF